MRKILLIIIISLFLVACNTEIQETTNEPPKSGTSIFNNEIKTTADGTKYIIPPNEIRGGGPPKGGIGTDRGIPALAEDNIKFVTERRFIWKHGGMD